MPDGKSARLFPLLSGVAGAMGGALFGFYTSVYLQNNDIEFERDKLTYELRLNTYFDYEKSVRELLGILNNGNTNMELDSKVRDLYFLINNMASDDVFDAANNLLDRIEEVRETPGLLENDPYKSVSGGLVTFQRAVRNELVLPR